MSKEMVAFIGSIKRNFDYETIVNYIYNTVTGLFSKLLIT